MDFHGLRRGNTQCFREFSEFWCHGLELSPVQTFHHEFSGSSPAQNLKLQYEISDWTKGKAKRLTGFHAQTKNDKISNQKNPTKIDHTWPPLSRKILLTDGRLLTKPSLQAIFQQENLINTTWHTEESVSETP